MSVTCRPDPVAEVSAHPADGDLVLDVYPDGNRCVVHASGELDLASRARLFAAAIAGNHPAMEIDLAEVTFMDCGGYRSLVACRLVLEHTGRSLTIKGQSGQPARFLDRIAAMERHDVGTGVEAEIR